MSKVVVTGGAGFIGSHLVRGLLDRGDEVHVLDNFLTGRRSNLEAVLDRITLHECDLRDTERLPAILAGVEELFHQAAIPSVPRSIAEPELTWQVNAEGTHGLLLAARDAGIRRVVYASSSSVYGDAAVSPKHEDLRPRPLSPYAAQKAACEAMAEAFSSAFGMTIVGLRYFNVFGPRQDPGSAYAAVVPKFITALLAGEAPVIYGDGEQTRDFTFVENVVQANLAAAEAEQSAVLNIAGGHATSVNQLFESLAELTGRTDIAARHDPPRPGDVRHSLADVDAAERLIGYRPAVDLDEGLRRTVEHYQALQPAR